MFLFAFVLALLLYLAYLLIGLGQAVPTETQELLGFFEFCGHLVDVQFIVFQLVYDVLQLSDGIFVLNSFHGLRLILVLLWLNDRSQLSFCEPGHDGISWLDDRGVANGLAIERRQAVATLKDHLWIYGFQSEA